MTYVSEPTAVGSERPVLRPGEVRVEPEWAEELDDVANGRLG